MGADCNVCGSAMSRKKPRMSCSACRYSICEVCWERRRVYLHGSPTRADSVLSVPQLTCTAGHLLERLVGQVVHGDRSCSSCGKESLGSTVPFFLSCRPCRYDLCPACSRNIERTFDSPVRCSKRWTSGGRKK